MCQSKGTNRKGCVNLKGAKGKVILNGINGTVNLKGPMTKDMSL